ncbi:MAG: hypothetical protein WDO15_27330 [Bacteroidota bacterium]
MKRLFAILILLVILTACGSADHTVEVTKPRLHNTWPKKHRWHKKLHIWKFTFQMPERGGVKKVKMKS